MSKRDGNSPSRSRRARILLMVTWPASAGQRVTVKGSTKDFLGDGMEFHRVRAAARSSRGSRHDDNPIADLGQLFLPKRAFELADQLVRVLDGSHGFGNDSPV